MRHQLSAAVQAQDDITLASKGRSQVMPSCLHSRHSHKALGHADRCCSAWPGREHSHTLMRTSHCTVLESRLASSRQSVGL